MEIDHLEYPDKLIVVDEYYVLDSYDGKIVWTSENYRRPKVIMFGNYIFSEPGLLQNYFNVGDFVFFNDYFTKRSIRK